MCSIKDDSASGESDEESADADSQPRPELPEETAAELAAELQAAAEADRLLVEAEGQEGEAEELQVAPAREELPADQPVEGLSDGLLAEELELQQSMEALVELQTMRLEEEFGSAAVGEEVVVMAEAEEPSADGDLEDLQAKAEAKAEEQTGLEGGFEVGSADAAGDEVDAKAAEEYEVHALTEMELQIGIEVAQLQPETGQDEAVIELGHPQKGDNLKAAGSEASAAEEAEEPTGAVDNMTTAAAKQGPSVQDAQSDSVEGEATLELREVDESPTALDPSQLLEPVNSRSAGASVSKDAIAEDAVQAELDVDASTSATDAQQPGFAVIEDTLLDVADGNEAAEQLLGVAEGSEATEQLLGAAAVEQVRTMLSDPAVVSSDPVQPWWNVFYS